jgi:hypothetical protein
MLAKHLSADTHVGQMPFLPKIEGNFILYGLRCNTLLGNIVEEEEDPKRAKTKKQKRYACGHPGCGKVKK